MTIKELTAELKISRRMIVNYMNGYKRQSKGKSYELPARLVKGKHYNIELINNRATTIFTDEGINKLKELIGKKKI